MTEFDWSNDPMEGKAVGTKGIIISHESLGPESHRFDSYEEATEAVNATLAAMGSNPVDIYPDIYGDVWARDRTGGEPYKIGHGE